MELASNGETVFVGGRTEPGYQGQLWAAPLVSAVSAVSAVSSGIDDATYANGPIAIGPGGSLVYVSGELTTESPGPRIEPNGVMMREASGRLVPILSRTAERLSNHVVADATGISWVSTKPAGGEPTTPPRSTTTLWRWDAATGTTRALGETRFTRHRGDGTTIFHTEWHGGTGTVVVTATSGGPSRVLGSLGPVTTWPELVDVDETAVYVGALEERSLFVMSKTSGEILRVITDLEVGWSTVAADATHLYWAAHTGTPRRLVRLEKATGAVEELLKHDELGPAVTVDSCNVYYSAGTAVFARAK